MHVEGVGCMHDLALNTNGAGKWKVFITSEVKLITKLQ